MGKVLVVINCGKTKSVDMDIVKARLGKVPGFDLENENEYRRLLSDFVKPAIDMYDGPEFKALRQFRRCVNVFILSARYGLIHGDRSIIPYDAYLSKARVDELILDRWRSYGNWDLDRLMRGNWDVAIIRLSKAYLTYFVKVVEDPCKLGREVHVIAGKYNSIRCNNVINHHVKGIGDSRRVLKELLSDVCGSSS
ncbi:MAG: DUF6884 domain-containing protein [Vulcanisaeta sp.]|uniref:DUF6884 domain-containing protein n=1 Tax=Vulcanisaeta sp. TaxID=2020871 RepID=UPI003D12DF61